MRCSEQPCSLVRAAHVPVITLEAPQGTQGGTNGSQMQNCDKPQGLPDLQVKRPRGTGPQGAASLRP